MLKKMKKILSIIMLMFAFVLMQNVEVKAQAVTATQFIIDGSGYGSFLGATTDTIVASGYRIQPIRMKGDNLFKMDIQLTVTKVSGTVTNNFIVQKSLDNVNWVAIDTIALSNASTGVNYLEIDNINYPYLRFYHVAPATTQKAYYKYWYVARRK